ncbi:hypothetical protein CGMCC3_g8330 [Colletotrichum fructicola]|nr:uncharacterized protein CGMCC3_g8330 [Colletotrichum fructicola]KAE9575689.1 hypothetical protein CGMCC3_g8330 [Colletotrichum fructicola]
MHLSPEQKIPFVATARRYPQSPEDFIASLLTYDPRDRRDYFERPSPRQKSGCFSAISDKKWWQDNAFEDHVSDGSILHDWLNSESSQFLWIEDETCAGHSLLVTKLLGKAEESTQLHDYIITYAFCDKRPDGTEEPNQFTVENVLAELIYNLLTANEDIWELVLPQIQNLYGNRIKPRETQSSRYTVFEKVLRHILRLSGRQKKFLILTDALDCLPADSLANDVSSFVLFMDSLASEFPNLKWAFSTGNGGQMTQLVNELDTSVQKLVIAPGDVAEAFDLDQECALPRFLRLSQTLMQAFKGVDRRIHRIQRMS